MGVTLYIITKGWEERSTPANTKWSVFIQSSAKSQYKVVVKPVSTVETATHNAPPTVKTAHVTYNVDRVFTVNLDGLGYTVTQVKQQISYLI